MTTRKNHQKNLTEDELAVRLSSNDAKESEAVLLTGYLGKSSREGCWRLFKAPDLREFDEADVVHCEKTRSDLFASVASLVWLKPTAELRHQRPSSSALAAEFLSGRIVDSRRGGSTFDGYYALNFATWTATATAAGVPTPSPGSAHFCTEGPLCVLAPETIGVCGSKCNVCGVSVPQ